MKKHIVITGGTRGIGNALVRAFLSRGCRVSFSGTNPETIQRALEELSRDYDQSSYTAAICDLRRVHDITHLYSHAVKTLGPVDIWVNSAGVAQPNKDLVDFSSKELRSTILINMESFLEVCRLIHPRMAEQGFGAIYAMEGYGSDGEIKRKKLVYGLTKYSLPYIVRAFALETADSPVLIGSLNPGIIRTDIRSEDNNQRKERASKYPSLQDALSDPVDTVTVYLTDRMLINTRSGVRIKWLNTHRVIRRIAGIPFRRIN